MHPSQAALCIAVTRNTPPLPRPPPEPRAPHLRARARQCAPPRAAGASPEPRATRTRLKDPRREMQPSLGRRRCRRRRRFRPCDGVTRGGRSRREQGGVGSPPSALPPRSPRLSHFRRCASRSVWGGSRLWALGRGRAQGRGLRRAPNEEAGVWTLVRGRLRGAGPGACRGQEVGAQGPILSQLYAAGAERGKLRDAERRFE